MKLLRALVFFGSCWVVLSFVSSARAQDQGGCPLEEPAFYLSSDVESEGSITASLLPGEDAALTVTARLRASFTDPGDFAQGYSLSITHASSLLEILSVTHAGTDTVGMAFKGGDFLRTELANDGSGFVAAFVTFFDNHGFPPAGDFSLAHARYRVLPHPEEPAPPAGSQVFDGMIEHRDGLQGAGAPVKNILAVKGQGLPICREPLPIRVIVQDTVDFFRGDANNDRRLDISDPATILHAAFYGDATIQCDDAADANDDGKVDISDAIYLLGYLFLGGSAPHAPFPGAGADPTEDSLRCRPSRHDVFGT